LIVKHGLGPNIMHGVDERILNTSADGFQLFTSSIMAGQTNKLAFEHSVSGVRVSDVKMVT
jgi:hypothetical protein